MLLGTLSGSLLGNMLAGKRFIRAGYSCKGKRIIRAGDGARRSLIKDF